MIQYARVLRYDFIYTEPEASAGIPSTYIISTMHGSFDITVVLLLNFEGWVMVPGPSERS